MDNNNLSNDFEVRQATLVKLGGDPTNLSNIYEVDLAILEKTGQGGGGGAQIDDADISTGKVWSSSKTNSAINTAGMQVEIVATLPVTGESKKIYLVPAINPSTGNSYDEYMWINNSWEKIGSTSIDLSNYYTKSQVDASLNEKQDKIIIVNYNDITNSIIDDIYLNPTKYKIKDENNIIYNYYSTLSTRSGNEVYYTADIIDANMFLLYQSLICLKVYSHEKTKSDIKIYNVYSKQEVNTKFNDVSTALSSKVGSTNLSSMIALSQAEYDALATKDASTFYVITANA